MRLYEQPCSTVTVGRRKYRLRLTYTRVLFALDAVRDPLLTDEDRVRLMLHLLVCGRIPTNEKRRMALLDAVLDQMNREHRPAGGPPVMSLTQDAPLIYAGFRQAYGIDLHAVDLPWATFCVLLSGLPESTRFCEVVSLRSRPVPPPDKHNARYREELLRAKAAVALARTEEERDEAYQAALNQLARNLMAWAEHTEGRTAP